MNHLTKNTTVMKTFEINRDIAEVNKYMFAVKAEDREQAAEILHKYLSENVPTPLFNGDPNAQVVCTDMQSAIESIDAGSAEHLNTILSHLDYESDLYNTLEKLLIKVGVAIDDNEDDKADTILIKCPECANWEEHPTDEQRKHLQAFDLIEWLPDHDCGAEQSKMKCAVCNHEFVMVWDYDKVLEAH